MIKQDESVLSMMASSATRGVDEVDNAAELTIMLTETLYGVYSGRYLLETFRRFEDAQVYIASQSVDSVHALLCSKYDL